MKRLSTPIQKSLILGSVAAAGLTGLSSAAVTYSENMVQQFQTEIISDFNTTGNEMTGMVFTVTFDDASTASASWVGDGDDGGSATSADNFVLTLDGTTFDNSWTLSNDSALEIVGFSFSGIEGQTVFDRTEPSTGTENSAQGADFSFGDDFSDWAADVTYIGPVRLEGAGAAVGDLFVSLDVVLPEQTVAAGTDLVFFQDTDNATFEISTIPEPSAGLAIGLLLSSAFLLRRRA